MEATRGVTAEHHRRSVKRHKSEQLEPEQVEPEQPKSKKTKPAKPKKPKSEKPKQAPLVYSRGQTAQLLNVSEMTVRRLEERGILKAVRLTPVPGAKVFYRAADIHALIGLNGS
jgi:hypothetical protein